ncbi:Flagellar hook-associated protein [Acidobacteriia bacterium SbA2]|nr:Flagellar hook-associated protein [Acidobacteriia bacterium SbA2]
MSTLFGALSIAVRSLYAQEGAIDTTSNNISNVDTPGYSRETPILSEAPPLDLGQISIGNGVDFNGVQSIRDNILELRIDQESQQQNQLTSYVNYMNQVQSLFNETQGSGLSDAINSFFNSFQQLADNPTDLPTRQAVISAGQDLASVFQQTGKQLTTIQQGADQEVVQTVQQINADTTQLADLNQQVSGLPPSSEQADMLEDNQYEVLNNLSQLVDVAVTHTGSGGLTVTTTNGTALVAGGQSFALSTETNASTGFQDVFSQGSDVTSTFTGGQLAGLLEARDQSIPSVTASVDNLAAGIINSVNTQSLKGYDLNADKGVDFFQPVVQPSPGSNAGAAENMAVAITDPSQVAASSVAGPQGEGDNANALALANIQNEAVVNGQTATDFYSDLVSTVGNDVSTATDEQESVGLVLTQLQNQRSNTSGVSLDEEASNLILYQRAYEAAAEVVSAVNSLTNDVIQTI